MGENEKAMEVLTQVANNDIEYIIWYLSLDDRNFDISFGEVRNCLSTLVKTMQIMERCGDKQTMNYYAELFDRLYGELEARVK